MTFVKTALFHKAGEGSGGGGDQHNLGWYATESALTTAHPTATAGDWAIVGSTDTVWLWDTDDSEWVDSDQKGQVTSVNGQTGAVTLDTLPSQTGNSGKFLTTDGTVASWSDKPLVNTATGTDALAIGGIASGTDSVNFGSTKGYGVFANYATIVGQYSQASGPYATAIGYDTAAMDVRSVAIGCKAKSNAIRAFQFGDGSNYAPNTVKFANANGNFEIMSADGTIPTDRLIHAINKYSTMPTAASTNEGWIVQFTGTTDSTYTHGHLYECVSDGQTPATYSWTEVSMGGGSSLPSQTGQSGKFLTTDGTDASWSDKPLINTATGSNALSILGYDTISSGSVVVGKYAGQRNNTNTKYSVSIGYGAGGAGGFIDNSVFIGQYSGPVTNGQNSRNSIAIGSYAHTIADNSIQLSAVAAGASNSDANTFKVANANGNFEMMSADGTIPHARLTNAVQSTTVTIATTDWSSNTASVTVSGLTATSVVWVAPDNASQSAYTTAGVYASSQSADTLTFTCTQTPTASLTINVVFC